MRFLVIGLGSIGTRHARNLLAMGHEVWGYDEAWGFSESEAKAQEKGVKFGFPDEGGYDAHIICTPTSAHYENMITALKRNAHIFVEKPIAAAMQVVQGGLPELLKEAARKNLVVAMGNNLRFHFSVKLAKRYLNEDAVGTPIWASIVCAQFNDRPQYRRDGVTLNWGAHELDLARYLLGPATVEAASIDKDDTIADICLVHENGCRSIVHLDYLTEPEMRQTVIVGTKGRMVVSLNNRYIALQRGDMAKPPDHQTGSFDEDYRNEMIAFVNALEGKPWPGATGEDGLETLKLIRAAQKMASQ